MKSVSSNQLAGLLALSLMVHQAEEYLMGFPEWYSNMLNVNLSDQDFIVINAVGLIIVGGSALSYLINRNNMILAAVGTLELVNGIIHLTISIFTVTYSPGTITGVILFLPLGIHIYRKILPLLKPGEQIVSIAIGIIVLAIASMTAMNI